MQENVWSDSHVGSILEQMETLKKEIDRSDTQYKVLRDSLKKEFEKYNTNRFVLDDGQEKILSALLKSFVTIDYDYEALKNALPENIFQQVVVQTVNSKKIEQLLEQRKIEPSDLIGTYTAKEKNTITVQRIKRPEEDIEEQEESIEQAQ